jgi:hypothetical protein
LFRRRKDQNEDLNVGRGKLEIQNQDSHFSTAQISLRRKEKGRLHKMLGSRRSKDHAPDEDDLQQRLYVNFG